MNYNIASVINTVAVSLLIALSFVYLCYYISQGILAYYNLVEGNAKVCIENGGQWVNNNCIKANYYAKS